MTVEERPRQTPVVREVDVAVCGGGPAGIAAALAAARTGARTVLIERYGFLGGMGTAGMVSSFAYGYHDKVRFLIGGIFQEIRESLHHRGALIMTERKGWEPFHPEVYKTLAFELLEEAGVEVLCHAFVADAHMAGARIDAAIIESKAGRQAIRAKVFVEATGDGDLAARAGVPFTVGRDSDGATQPMTLMFVLGNVDIHKLGPTLERGYWKTEEGRPYLNATGFRSVVERAKEAGELRIPREDVSAIFTIPWLEGVVGVNFGRIQGLTALDPACMTKAEMEGRRQVANAVELFHKYLPGFENAQLIYTGPQVGVRETRRMHGLYCLTQEDIFNLRQFDDVIAQSCYMIDIHLPDRPGTTFWKLPKGTHYDIPYHSLLPQKIENLLLAGRCISATHEALGSFRVQAICMAIGQAAGTAAALGAQSGISPKQLRPETLQKRLDADGAILQ